MHIGISAYFHDSTVALISNNGELLDFKKEEWLSRIKGDKSFPRLALENIINSHKLDNSNVKSISFYEKPVKAWITILKHSVKSNSLNNSLTRNYFKNVWKSSIVFYYDISKYFKKIPIYYADHHLSHTLSALYYYQSSPCVSIVVDGYGDQYCTSIHHVKSHNNIVNVWKSDYPNSLGLFYSSITDFLGFAINEGEYKVMGLASYGKPIFFKELSRTIEFKNNNLILNTKYFDFVRDISKSYSEELTKLFKILPRKSNEKLDINSQNFQIYADIAASAQKVLEHILEKLFQLAYDITKEENILFTGGVAMNCVAVTKLSELDFVKKIIVPPSPGDSGAAIGASFFGYLKQDNKTLPNKKINLINTNLFPACYNVNKNFFDEALIKVSEKDNAIIETAKLIEQNKIVATCYGNAETGPRALGHRSLICNGHNHELIKTLNSDVKQRSIFRPTAPAILDKFANDFFYLSPKLNDCYVHMACVARPKKPSKDLKGIIHFDNTSRIQICNKDQLLGKILLKLVSKNIFILANTSFNVSSDPMVFDSEDAYAAMLRMKIDYLLTEEGLYKIK